MECIEESEYNSYTRYKPSLGKLFAELFASGDTMIIDPSWIKGTLPAEIPDNILQKALSYSSDVVGLDIYESDMRGPPKLIYQAKNVDYEQYMNLWFHVPHWIFDETALEFIEISDSRSHDSQNFDEPREGSVMTDGTIGRSTSSQNAKPSGFIQEVDD